MKRFVLSDGFWAVALLLWTSLSAIQGGRFLCFGCPLEEYEALIKLKSSLVLHRLDSWGSGRDCCRWERVSCGNSTGRVSDLMLSYLYGHTDPFIDNRPYWQVDLSILSSFDELRLLNLSGNGILGSLPCIGLKKLEVLDLSSNRLEGSIPSCFVNLSSLTFLNLGGNYLEGTLSLLVPVLLGMKKLEVLDLSNNAIDGGIPISLGNLSSLRVLNLHYNYVTGSLPIDVFDGLQSLQELHLEENMLNGTLPPSIGMLASLQHLDFSDNAMEGNMASQVFANLTSLQYLDLSGNNFTGRFTFLDLANLSKLEAVILSNNEELAVDLGGGSSTPSFQLKVLLLSSCNLDKNTFNSPIFLSSQYKLEALDVSHNYLIGDFPNRWFENQTRLVYLKMGNNSLQGVFQLPGNPNPSLKVLSLSSNSIGGSLPSHIGTVFPGMLILDFSWNHLIGDIPSSLGIMTGLTFLDLSNNNFSGEIPASLITNCTALYLLKLSNNKLNGTLITLNHLGPRTEYVYLDGNELTGTLPRNFSADLRLETLHVHDNQLSGEIPGTIGAFPTLTSINLGGNRFQGQDLQYLCNRSALITLDLSNNKFSGRMPHCLPLYLEYINLAGNSFTGSIPTVLFSKYFSFLKALDLSNNQLSGNLPSHIVDDMHMGILLLSGNAFEGLIPNKLCKLRYLHLLDLSHNLLSGSVPSCFGKMQFRSNDRPMFGALFDVEYIISIFTSIMVIDETLILRDELQEVEFITKEHRYGYERDHLVLMNGIDLSANHLTGGIPPELGSLGWIKSLNLSYNCLTGRIPESFSNLSQIESLDISHNQLSGRIPWQLTQLTSLEVFSVAHNNLSGCIPEFKNQFATFTESSYEGNTGLHGPPLEKTCTSNSSSKVPQEEASSHDFDDVIIYAISIASFAMGFWVCIAVLYCSRKGRYMRIQLIDRFADSLYERISLIVYKLELAYQNVIRTRR